MVKTLVETHRSTPLHALANLLLERRSTVLDF